MTTDKTMGSKLANSVRQAKEQQTQETLTPPAPRQKEVAAPAKKEVTSTYFIPSKRVWPD